MSRRQDRVGLSTTTISVKLTAAELEGLDSVRAHHESLFDQYRWFSESRGDALRRLISEAAERRTEEKKRTDPRRVTLNEAIAASSSTAGKTGPAAAGAPRRRKTSRRKPGAVSKRSGSLWQRGGRASSRIRR